MISSTVSSLEKPAALPMAAAAPLAGDRGDVQRVRRRAHRDAARRAGRLGRLTDGHRQLDAVDPAQLVDHTLRVLLPDAELLEVGAQEVARDHPALLVAARPRQRLADQLLAARTGPTRRSAWNTSLGLDALLDQLGREPMRLRRRVRVLEPAGVGVDRDVQRLGDLQASARRRARRAGRGRSRRSTTRSGTIRLIPPYRVLSWWWSTSIDERRRLQQLRRQLRPRRGGAVQREDDPLGDIVRQLRDRPPSCMNAYSGGSTRSPPTYITLSLPRASSAELHRQDRPEGVPVGVLVGDEEESVVARGSRRRPRPAHSPSGRARRSACSCGLPLPRYDRIRRSVAGSASVSARARCGTGARRGRRQARRASPVAPSLGAEHADEDACVPEVGRGLDAGDGDEPDAGVLQLRQRLREHLPHRLVDAAHAIAHEAATRTSPRGTVPAEPEARWPAGQTHGVRP